jgi:P4 family phage/plasmid primase-like protien
MPFISDFIKQQNILTNTIGVFLDDEGTKRVIGEPSKKHAINKECITEDDLKLWKGNFFRNIQNKTFPSTVKEFYFNNKMNPLKESKKVEEKKALYLRFTKNLYCVDVDDKDIKTVEDFGYFKNCLWKEGNNKGIHIYVFINNVPEYSNQQKIWHNEKYDVDLIKKNNMWEDDKKPVYNFNNNNEYPIYEWNDIQHLFNTNSMNKGDIKDKKLKIKKDVKIEEDKINNSSIYSYNMKDYEVAEKALKCLNINRITGYQSWRNIGCILYYEFKDDGFKLFDEVSKRAPNYSNEGVINEWDIIQKYNYMDIKLGTLLYWARQDNPEFCINEEEEYYKPKRILDYTEGLNEYYYKAIYERDDRHVSRFISYLYPDYFVSDNKYLYIFTQYGIYKKDDEGYYLNKIIEGAIKHIENIIFNINIFKEYEELNKTDDEISEIKKSKKERISKIKELIKYFGTNKAHKDLKATIIKNSIVLKLKEKMDETNKDIIGFENGVYDLNTKTFRKGKADEFISTTTGYNYIDENQDEINRVYEIINSMWDSEKKTKYFLHKLAYTLTGNKTRQEVNIHTGLGGNGKSLIFDLLKKTLGDYYTVMSPEYFTNYEKGTDRANSQLVATKGKRIVVVSEPAESSKLQVNKLKMLSGNELIKTRDLNEKAIEFYPQFFIHMLTNDIPKLSNSDGGIERRLKIITYPFEFKDKDDFDTNNKNHKIKDPNLGKEINSLYMAFFHLLTQYFKIDYEDIDEIKATTKEYFIENNPVEEWIKENYIITNNIIDDRITFQDLKEEFINDNEQQPPNDVTFSNRLQKLGLIKFKSSKQGKTIRGYAGLKRKPIEPIKSNNNDEDDETIEDIDQEEIIIDEDDETI